MEITDREMKQLVYTLKQLRRDIACCQKRVDSLYARYARYVPDAPNAPDARIVNTQNSNNCPTVNNKQKQTCVCVSVTNDRTENTHTQVLSLDFIKLNLPEGIPAWYAAYWFEQMKRRNWSLKDGKRVTSANWQYFLGVFFSHATDEELATAQKYGQEATKPAEDLIALRERLLAENEKMWA